jgi:hypothetical protein
MFASVLSLYAVCLLVKNLANHTPDTRTSWSQPTFTSMLSLYAVCLSVRYSCLFQMDLDELGVVQMNCIEFMSTLAAQGIGIDVVNLRSRPYRVIRAGRTAQNRATLPCITPAAVPTGLSSDVILDRCVSQRYTAQSRMALEYIDAFLPGAEHLLNCEKC